MQLSLPDIWIEGAVETSAIAGRIWAPCWLVPAHLHMQFCLIPSRWIWKTHGNWTSIAKFRLGMHTSSRCHHFEMSGGKLRSRGKLIFVQKEKKRDETNDNFFVGWQLNAKWFQYWYYRLLCPRLKRWVQQGYPDQIQEQGRWEYQVNQGPWGWNNKALCCLRRKGNGGFSSYMDSFFEYQHTDEAHSKLYIYLMSNIQRSEDSFAPTGQSRALTGDEQWFELNWEFLCSQLSWTSNLTSPSF